MLLFIFSSSFKNSLSAFKASFFVKNFLKPSAFDTEDIPAILAIPDTLFFLPVFPFSDYCLKHRKAQFVEYQLEES